MKKYEAPQAQVVSFDNDYVAATTAPSTSGSGAFASIVAGGDDSGDIVIGTDPR